MGDEAARRLEYVRVVLRPSARATGDGPVELGDPVGALGDPEAHVRHVEDVAAVLRAQCQGGLGRQPRDQTREDRKSTRLNSSHVAISYAVFCLKKKKHTTEDTNTTRTA